MKYSVLFTDDATHDLTKLYDYIAADDVPGKAELMHPLLCESHAMQLILKMGIVLPLNLAILGLFRWNRMFRGQLRTLVTGSTGMVDKTEKTEFAILRVLNEAQAPMGSTRIGQQLQALGVDLNQRTVRLYLSHLDQRGLTTLASRRGGRMLTAAGREEVESGAIIERLGFASARIDALSFRMSLDIKSCRGTVILNLSHLSEANFERAKPLIRSAYQNGFGMGRLMLLRRAGERIGGFTVRDGEVVLGTVCSFTVNGVLLGQGIPVRARYGGLVEVRDRTPLRFTTLVDYSGCTIDPLETFIRAKMTSVAQVCTHQRGIIGASFREVPAVAMGQLFTVLERMKNIGLAGMLLVGRPNQDLLGVPVSPDRAGLVAIGGMNPVAAAYESGIDIHTDAMSCLHDFKELEDFEKLLT